MLRPSSATVQYLQERPCCFRHAYNAQSMKGHQFCLFASVGRVDRRSSVAHLKHKLGMKATACML